MLPDSATIADAIRHVGGSICAPVLRRFLFYIYHLLVWR